MTEAQTKYELWKKNTQEDIKRAISQMVEKPTENKRVSIQKKVTFQRKQQFFVSIHLKGFDYRVCEGEKGECVCRKWLFSYTYKGVFFKSFNVQR